MSIEALLRPPDLIGESARMQHVRLLIHLYAPLRAPVLIHGETGTGKELVARALHEYSPRAALSFVAVNAAAICPALIDSELFGHERGSFTGAVRDHAGVFEQAGMGTLFVDELAELPLSAQARLLRALENGEVRRVGCVTSRRVTMRVIAATNANLHDGVRRGTFRADLYHRIAVLHVRTPALRDRVEDIPAIAEHLLLRLQDEHGKRSLTPKAIDALTGYAWPGNVRQLLNVIRRTCAVNTGKTISGEMIRAALADEPIRAAVRPVRRAVVMPTTDEITTALHAANGRLSGAARLLGMPRTTLREHLRRQRIPR
ncbi:MAG: sigma-54-dependent Fis family transcriptional regulator [Deltaproteobacteria bacterium]|nr:sigma-54-dependent Fis family transcriptional regulator [Deltaproteobacteria bacterium]